jgi:hypothetical protein
VDSLNLTSGDIHRVVFVLFGSCILSFVRLLSKNISERPFALPFRPRPYNTGSLHSKLLFAHQERLKLGSIKYLTACTIVIENLSTAYLDKKLPPFYGTRCFTTMSLDGVMVSVFANEPKVRGFKPARVMDF